MKATDQRPVLVLADALGEEWSHIRSAHDATNVLREQLSRVAESATTDDVAFVVFGAAARGEISRGSDLDWTLLIDGASDPAHFESALTVARLLNELGVTPPGREETFGGLAFSHELLHRIGGSDDTNRNTTQRILLLLESAPVGTRTAYDRVMRNVLRRYITEDWGWTHDRGPARVPRFLQNDLARYWRTVAVDFAYKRRDRGGRGWALRTVKLRLSRKMTYAAGLLACFSCELEDVFQPGEREKSAGPVIQHLQARLAMTPLDIVATSVLQSPDLSEPARALFGAYDEFLAILDDEEKREHLDALEPKEADRDAVYDEARAIGHRFQEGLDGVFFGDDQEMARLTRIYGVF